jgi:ABC-type branched-subunit amino acid transport system ATPase component/ABC-type branched-subunit amino acid transport system permease subunit
VLGYGGQLSLAQFTIAGIGALLTSRFASLGHLPLPLVFVLVILLTVPIGVLVALPAVRVRGVSLAVLTLGLGLAIGGVVFSNPSFTMGKVINGSPQQILMPPAKIGGYKFDAINHPQRYAIFCLIVLVFGCLIVLNVRRGRSGRRLLAVRNNERGAMSLGVSVVGAKLYAFGLASAIAAAAGVLIAYGNTYVDYGQFGGIASVQLVLLSVVGGVGSVVGAILGGIFGSGGLLQDAFGSVANGDWFAFLTAIGVVMTVVLYPDGLAIGVVRRSAGIIKATRHRLKKTAVRVERNLNAGIIPKISPKQLVISEISVAFGATQVLSDLSITVSPGEVVGLIGPNGAGKTTLIDVASGFVRSQSGSVSLGGKALGRFGPARRCREGLARSFQSLELFDDLTVEDNLRAASESHSPWTYFCDLIWPRRMGLSPGAVASIVEFGLEPVLDQYPSDLSYAQRRLAAVARSVSCAPSVLLLDEPAAGLDSTSRDELAALIQKLARGWGIGVLLIEHDVQMVMSTCDRVVAIDFGLEIASGAPDAVRHNASVVDAYLGGESDPVNIAG